MSASAEIYRMFHLLLHFGLVVDGLNFITNSAWAVGNLAEEACLLRKIVEHPTQIHERMGHLVPMQTFLYKIISKRSLAPKIFFPSPIISAKPPSSAPASSISNSFSIRASPFGFPHHLIRWWHNTGQTQLYYEQNLISCSDKHDTDLPAYTDILGNRQKVLL